MRVREAGGTGRTAKVELGLIRSVGGFGGTGEREREKWGARNGHWMVMYITRVYVG